MTVRVSVRTTGWCPSANLRPQFKQFHSGADPLLLRCICTTGFHQWCRSKKVWQQPLASRQRCGFNSVSGMLSRQAKPRMTACHLPSPSSCLRAVFKHAFEELLPVIKSSSPDLQQVLSVNPGRRVLGPRGGLREYRVSILLRLLENLSDCSALVPLGPQFELNCGFLLIMHRDNDDRQLGWNFGCAVRGNAACVSTQTIVKGE